MGNAVPLTFWLLNRGKTSTKRTRGKRHVQEKQQNRGKCRATYDNGCWDLQHNDHVGCKMILSDYCLVLTL